MVQNLEKKLELLLKKEGMRRELEKLTLNKED
jgi:hypothetical protein